MKYHDPGCAYCPPTVRACRQGEGEERGPGYCPSKVDPEGVACAYLEYEDPEVRRIAQISASMEAEGYTVWCRLQEIVELAKRMNFKKIGIACCVAFVDHAKTLSGIFESHGFEVASLACKHGGFAKEEMALKEENKIRPGNFEAMCNPISQARLLERAGCEFNVMLGLCVGHDSLFFMHSNVLTTVLFTKDRVLAHNAIGALYLAETYYSRVWGPDRPEKPPKLPAEGRRKAKTA